MNSSTFNKALQVCLLALAFVANAGVAEIPEERRHGLEAAQAGTVSIKARTHVDANSQYGDVGGTGFIVAKHNGRAIIATNCHVACNKAWLWVTVYNNQTRRVHAKFITGDAKQDIALISIPAYPGMQVLPLLDGVPEQGEQAVAIGSPLGVRWTVTAGIFSVLNRTDMNYPTPDGVHQTDAAINPGNSGGPLLVYKDGRYQVAGMNTFIMTNGAKSNTGLSFAVPSSDIRRILDAIVTGQSPVRNTLGGMFSAISDFFADMLGVPMQYQEAGVNGVYLTALSTDTPLYHAGIRPGDVILKVNNQMVNSPESLRRAVYNAEPYLPVNIVYLRNGEIDTTLVFAANEWGKDVQLNGARSEEGEDYEARQTSVSQQPSDQTSGNQEPANQPAVPSNPLAGFGFALLDSTSPRYSRSIGPIPEKAPFVLRIQDLSAAHYYGVKRNDFLRAIGFKGMAPQPVETKEDIANLFELAESQGIDTSSAVFIFVRYLARRTSEGTQIRRVILPPVPMDTDAVPPPA